MGVIEKVNERINKAKKATKRAFAVVCTAALIGTAIPLSAINAYADNTVYASTTANLNLRTGAGTNYSIIKVLDKNLSVTVVDKSNTNWIKVRLSDGTTGYCSADYLDITTDASTTTYVNLRKGPATSYTVIKTLSPSTKLDILKFWGSSWAYVRLSDGTTGYICTDYVTYDSASVVKTSGTTTTTASSISLSASSKKLVVGKTFQLKASSNEGTVIWDTSDEKVATVTSSGLVKALSAGTAVITAKDSKTNKTVKCTITAVRTDFTTLVLSASSKSLTVGETFSLTASTDTNSGSISFKSSNTSVAKVDKNGKVTATGAGTANITASDSTGLITASCSVAVQNKDAISLSHSSISVNEGSSVTVTAYKSNASTKVYWSSSNINVASVNEGRISGIGAGTATITASDSTGKVYAKCTVTVYGVSRGYVGVSRSSVSTTAGKTVYIKGYNGGYWNTSDANIATVSDGFILAKKPGRAAISYCDYYGNKAICVITVSEAAPVRFAYSSPNSATLNSKVTLTAITDKTVTDAYFYVRIGNKNLKVNATSKVANGDTYIWKGAFIASEAGTFKMTAYAKKNGQWQTCSDAVSDVYVTSKTNSSATGLDELRASDDVIKFIGEKEGFVSSIMYDTLANNIPTLAYGYVVSEGEQFYNGLTREEGLALLTNTVNHDVYTSRVNQMLIENNIRFNQQQFDALVSFSYNLGTGWTYSSDLKNILLNSYGTVATGTKMVGTVTASSELNLRDQASTSGKVVTVLSKGETVTLASTTKYNTVWYKVTTSSGKTGYCSSTYLNVYSTGGTSTVRDLTCVNKNALINEMLAYHHSGGVCYYGLLYRRVDELEMFLYNDYTADGRSNKHYFPSPYCISF